MGNPMTTDGSISQEAVEKEANYHALNGRRETAAMLRALSAATQRPIVTVNGDGEATEVTWNGETWKPKTSAPALRRALEAAKQSLTARERALSLINEYAGNDNLWSDNSVYTRRLILAAVTAAKGETK